MSTAATAIRTAAEYDNPNVVKVVVNAAGRALYFSRRTIPYLREAASRSVSEQLAAFPFLKHLGIYGYRRETLLRLVRFPVSPLEAGGEAGAVARAGKRHRRSRWCRWTTTAWAWMCRRMWRGWKRCWRGLGSTSSSADLIWRGLRSEVRCT